MSFTLEGILQRGTLCISQETRGLFGHNFCHLSSGYLLAKEANKIGQIKEAVHRGLAGEDGKKKYLFAKEIDFDFRCKPPSI